MVDNLTFLFGHRDPDVQPHYYFPEDNHRHQHMLPGHNEYRRNRQHSPQRQGPRNNPNHVTRRNTTNGPGMKTFVPWVTIANRYPEINTIVEVTVYTSPLDCFRLPRAYYNGGLWINADTEETVGGDVKFWRHHSKTLQIKS